MSIRRSDADGTEKHLAREKIIALFSVQRWPAKLHMLTLPGTQWTFERQLLSARPTVPTYFTAVERNRANFLIAQKAKPKQATLLFADIDAMMAAEWENAWDAAWIDYNGPLTNKRLQNIKRFYYGFIRSTLIITALKGRWSLDTGIAIDRAGGHLQWLTQHLVGEVLHDLEYLDTTPMMQFAIRHRSQWRQSVQTGRN
jgi:hypothetical protein